MQGLLNGKRKPYTATRRAGYLKCVSTSRADPQRCGSSDRLPRCSGRRCCFMVGTSVAGTSLEPFRHGPSGLWREGVGAAIGPVPMHRGARFTAFVFVVDLTQAADRLPRRLYLVWNRASGRTSYSNKFHILSIWTILTTVRTFVDERFRFLRIEVLLPQNGNFYKVRLWFTNHRKMLNKLSSVHESSRGFHVRFSSKALRCDAYISALCTMKTWVVLLGTPHCSSRKRFKAHRPSCIPCLAFHDANSSLGARPQP